MSENEQAIIPRFEFRAFAQSFGRVITEIRKRAETQHIRESKDIYLVTRDNNTHNVKMRYSQLDVKELINVEKGLEQWYPALKLDFPVEGERIRDEIFPALQVAAPSLEDGAYSARQFLDEIIWPTVDVHQATVFKQRFHYMIEGCMIEINELLINGAAIQSVAVEAAEAGAVLYVRDRLGLEPYENVNYLRAIKRIMGLEPLPGRYWF